MAAAALAAWTGVAASHDSWLQALPVDPGAGLLALQLGNGARYPRSEFSTPAPRVAQAACRPAAAGGEEPLLPRAERPPWLELRARLSTATAVGCWLELKPQETVLDAEQVRTYFDEVRTSDAVRTAWQEQQRAGLAWREVYRKYLRIEKPGPVSEEHATLVRAPRGFALELVPAAGHPLRAGVAGEFLVLAQGRPVADVAVEFVSRRNPVGLWQRSDASGRVRITLPFAGDWLLRATVIDPWEGGAQAWQSRHASLQVTLQ